MCGPLAPDPRLNRPATVTDDDSWDADDWNDGDAAVRDARLRDAGIDPRDRQLSEPREKLRKIANYQRGLNWCVLANIVGLILLIASAVIAQEAERGGADPDGARATASLAVIVFALIWLAVSAVASLAFCFLLGRELHGWAAGLAAAAFAWVSCVGLLALLILSSGATRRLKASGIPVGLLGAKRGSI